MERLERCAEALRRFTLVGIMQPLLSEGDLDRGRPPDVGSAYFHCGIVDPAIGIVCIKRLQGR
jgi:hypothetical protein